MSISVDLIDLFRADDSDEGVMWSGRLPHVPTPNSVLDVGLGHGPRYAVGNTPPRWNLKAYEHGGTNREHDVASVIVWVTPVQDEGAPMTSTASDLPVPFASIDALESADLTYTDETPEDAVRAIAAPMIAAELRRLRAEYDFIPHAAVFRKVLANRADELDPEETP